MSEEEKTCGSCDDRSCSAKEKRPGETEQEYNERTERRRRMCAIKHKIIVLSGKGGVGKSTVAVNLALALASERRKVGILDVDIHGPSIPRMLDLEASRPHSSEMGIQPIPYRTVKVMSIGFLLPHRDDAVIWRGPRKMGMIKEFLSHVEWGDLDYLVVDCPPGTGDEPLSLVQLMEDVTGAVIVTTPQDLAVLDVRKSVTFCGTLGVNILGVVENMSGFSCPRCGEVVDVFGSGGGEAMARDMGVPFLGRIPLDSSIVEAGDTGRPFGDGDSTTAAGSAFAGIVSRLKERIDREKLPEKSPADKIRRKEVVF